MGVVNFSDFREERGINDEQWNNIRKDAREIFIECEGDLQCIKSRGWGKVSDDVRELACLVVVPFQY